MEMLSLTCNNCGAPINVPEDANFVTCSHCGSRLEIKHTDTASYTKVLERIDDRTEHMSEDLQAIKLQNELEQVDREWQMERERYLVRNKNGSTSTPDGGNIAVGVIGAVLAIGFLLFWISSAATMGAPGFFVLFGVGMLVLVVVGIISSISKADGYRNAEQDYKRRRESIMTRLNNNNEE